MTTTSSSTRVSAKDLSLKEKAQVISGRNLWELACLPRHQVPSIRVADGPHGVRRPVKELSLQESLPATCFPTACALACSWDENLLNEVGLRLRNECLHYNVSVLLGPGMNLKRHPGGGRNFEYFSEDPLLSGRLAAAYVQGVQQDGQVGACIKHFCVNNQESHRFVVNAVVDERTLRELYLRSFQYVVQEAQPATIMCAYNQVNGVYCSEHERLLQQILRDEWNFQGACVTDWGATNHRISGIKAGMDLEMPGSHGAHDQSIGKALKDGNLTMEQLDACVDRVLHLVQKYQGAATIQHAVDWKEHHTLAKQVAMQCAVLLKNDDHFLPLKLQTSVAVVGDFGREHPRYQGMGSSQVHTKSVITVYEELLRYTDHLDFCAGYHADLDDEVTIDQAAIDEAVEVARKVDTVLLCIGLPEIMESEGFDRERLSLPAHHYALVEAIVAVNPNVCVILSNGGVVELPWADKVKAIFEGYLLGETGGAAIVDLIFGVESPCGKLAETFPLHQSEILADKYFPGTRHTVKHREGLDVGYRHFDSTGKDVRYPFGHGLSYVDFVYENMQVNVDEDETGSVKVQLAFDIQNTGDRMAREIAQVYVHCKESKVYRPEQELRDFTKVSLEAGERKSVTLTLTENAFAFYDVGVKGWVTEVGRYELRVGSSSRDVRLRTSIDLRASKAVASDLAISTYPPVNGEYQDEVSDEVFARRLGLDALEIGAANSSSSIPLNLGDVLPTQFHRNTLLKEVAKIRLTGKLLLEMVYREAAKEVKPGPSAKRQRKMVRANVENLPLRVLVLFSRGNLSYNLLDAMLSMMNFQVIDAIKGFAKAFAGMFRGGLGH